MTAPFQNNGGFGQPQQDQNQNNQAGGFGQPQGQPQGGYDQNNQAGGFGQPQGGYDQNQNQNQGGFGQPQGQPQGGFGQPQGQPQGGFDQNQNNQGGSSQQPQQIASPTFTPVDVSGFAQDVPNVSSYAKLSDHVGNYFVMRVKGFGTRTFNQAEGAKKTVECDIILVDPQNPSNPQVFNDQGFTNGKVISAAEALVRNGNSVTIGLIGLGERKGGNNAPIILQSIDSTTPDGQQATAALIALGQQHGWIPQQ